MRRPGSRSEALYSVLHTLPSLLLRYLGNGLLSTALVAQGVTRSIRPPTGVSHRRQGRLGGALGGALEWDYLVGLVGHDPVCSLGVEPILVLLQELLEELKLLE